MSDRDVVPILEELLEAARAGIPIHVRVAGLEGELLDARVVSAPRDTSTPACHAELVVGKRGGGDADDVATVVERDSDRDLRFTGRVIGNASSRDDEKAERWTEVWIYATNRGNYVVSIVGRSIKPDEVDRHSGLASAAPKDLVDFLMQRGGFLTIVAKEALEDAASNDPAFAEAILEEV
jgi:hypothetical protein